MEDTSRALWQVNYIIEKQNRRAGTWPESVLRKLDSLGCGFIPTTVSLWKILEIAVEMLQGISMLKQVFKTSGQVG